MREKIKKDLYLCGEYYAKKMGSIFYRFLRVRRRSLLQERRRDRKEKPLFK